MTSRFFWGLLLFTTLLGGCAGVDRDAPPPINYGQDICARCGMIIEDPRFAAGYLTESGESAIFDDIGDMLLHQAETGDVVYAYWVHDYETEAWLHAETAFFVLTPEIHTPMGYGVVALAEEGQATALALRRNGRVLTFAELQQETATLQVNHDDTGHNH
ncbi:MAG: nitrous oxide reductase accessory protein NosL [Candidatus Promineifilaceae bacterium]